MKVFALHRAGLRNYRKLLPFKETMRISLCFVLALTLHASAAEPATGGTNPARWWKGNLHTHSLWSDGDDYPEMIADWYARHGYRFLALSDHNVLPHGPTWLGV